MGLGKMNRITLQLIAQGQITGTAGNVDVTGNHARLPCKAVLEDADVTAYALSAAATAIIKAYAGTTVAGTEVASGTIVTATPRADMTIVAAQKNVRWPKNQEFCLGENTTNLTTIDGLSVTLTFREWDA